MNSMGEVEVGMDHCWPWPASCGRPGCARGGRWASGAPDHLYRTTALRTRARRAVRNSVVEDECKAVGDQAALGVSRRVETLRPDRGVGRDPAIGRPEAVPAFEPPALALGVEVGATLRVAVFLPRPSHSCPPTCGGHSVPTRSACP